jgi:hypothetical protein
MLDSPRIIILHAADALSVGQRGQGSGDRHAAMPLAGAAMFRPPWAEKRKLLSL